ncbi:MAG: hypothetical protein IJ678_04430 [Kiritimatiellae bacterium]|nr:hypothetical protein [Kiritimatiellia bacterium]
MAEKTKLVEVHLERVEFADKGTAAALRRKTVHSLVSVVHWPRYAYQQRVVARKIEIDGSSRDYGEGDWIDAVLFKESLQLPCAVTFGVSVPLAPDAVAKTLGALAKVAMGVAGDLAEAAAPTKSAGKIASSPFDTLGAILAGTDASTLGEGSMFFDEELLSKGGTRTVGLRATEDVSKPVASAGKAAPARRRTVRRAGDLVATIRVAVRPI